MAGYTPVDPQPLARTLIIWIWIDLGATTVALVTTLLHAQAASRLPGTDPASYLESPVELVGADALIAVGALPELVALLVAGFLTLKWIYRTSRNAHALADGLSVRPPWAVGWFFVPFATC